MEQNKVKFSVKDKPEFVVELREKVAQYFETNNISKFGNANLVIKTIFMLAVYLIPYVLMLAGVISSLGGVILCWVIIGMGKAGVGMAVMHDANHRTYSKNQTANKWLGKTLYLLGGFPPNWQHQHNTLHHGFTNVEGTDEDIDPGPYLRISPHKPLLKVHKFQHWYAWFLYGFMTLSWVTSKDFVQFFRYKKMGVKFIGGKSYGQLLTSLIIGKGVYYLFFMVLPIIILPFAWYWIVLFFFIMHFVSGLILTTIFQAAHVVTAAEFPLPDKAGNMENNWAIHQLITTSNFAPNNKLVSWLLGGLNFQVEHHLFPNISHVHYPKISKLVKSVAHKYSVPYNVQPGFFGAIWDHARMLKRLGRA